MSYEHAFASRSDLEKYRSNALLLFAIELRFQIEDIHTVAEDALTDGSDDKKCDLVYIDTDEGIAVVAQGYLSSDRTKQAAPANKAADLNTAAGWLLGRALDDLPARLKPSALQLREAIQDGKIRSIHFWYVHNLPESTNVDSELKTVQLTATAGLKLLLPGSPQLPDVVALEVGKARLTEWYQSLTNTILVTDTFEINIPGGYEIGTSDWSAYVTAVPATWLYKIFEVHKAGLFSANIRGYLGSRDVDANINNGIKRTAHDDPEHFWPYNNGLTILVNKFERISPNVLRVHGVSIVNGAQTTGAIGSLDATPSASAMVPARFVSCSHAETVRNIIKYNNSQNRVEAPDFRSGDVVQKRLREEFASIPSVTYFGGRRGGEEDRIRRPANLLPSDTAGQALAAFHGDPVIAYNEKSQIWISDRLYARYFSERTTARHIVLAFSLLRAVEAKKMVLRQLSDGGLLTETQAEQLEFLRFRGATFLLSAAIASCLEVIVGRAVPDKFRVSFGRGVSPADAQKHWEPIIESTVPFSSRLQPAVLRGLKNTEIAGQAMRDFRSLVEAVKAANKAVFETFARALVED
jgi:hypothetical protein